MSFTVDPERQIREASQELLFAVVKNDKKWLSSVIKDLFYSWIGALNDSVASVSAVATRAFDLCFGRERYADVCKIAHKTIVQECSKVFARDHDGDMEDEETRMYRIQELNHGLKGLQFLIENADAGVLASCYGMESFQMILHCGNFRTLLATFPDQALRASCYLFLALLASKSVLGTEDISQYVPYAYTDLGNFSAPFALSFLTTTFPSCGTLEALIESIKNSLPSEMPKDSIKDISAILVSLKQDADKRLVLDSIHHVISHFKGFDSTRLSAIWNLYVCCSMAYGVATVRDAIRNFLAQPYHSRGIRAQVFRLFLGHYDSLLVQELTVYLESDVDAAVKMEFLLVVPNELDTSALTSFLADIFSKSAPETRHLYFDRIVALSSTTSLVTQYVRLYIDWIFSRQDLEELASLSNKIFKTSIIPPSLSTVASAAYFRNLPLLEPKTQLVLFQEIISVDAAKTVVIDDQIALLALDNYDDHLELLATHLFQKCNARWLSLNPKAFELVKGLKEQVHTAIQRADESFCKIIVKIIALHCGQNIDNEESIWLLEATLKYCWDLDFLVATMECLLSGNPRHWRHLLQAILDVNSSIINAIHRHLQTTVAVYSLQSPSKLEDRCCWEPESKDRLALCLLQSTFSWVLKQQELSDAPEMIDLLLEVSTITACLDEERNYHMGPASFTTATGDELLITLKRSLDDSGQVSLLKSRLQALLLEHKGPYCILARKIKFVVKQEFALELSDDLLYSDLEEFCQANASSQSRLRNHVRSSIYLNCIMKGNGEHKLGPILRSNANKLWQIMTWMAVEDEPVSALTGLAESLSRAVMVLQDELSFLSGDEIAQILFSASFEAMKVTCRALLMKRLDLVLETAKVELEQCKDVPRLLLSWKSLYDYLFCDHRRDSSMVDCFFSLDLFLCLAEGSRENLTLASQYALIFRDSMAEACLPRLCRLLGWFNAEGGTDVADLSRVEFTVLRLEESLSLDLVQVSANLLFRCTKAFPAYLRGWYDGLRREEAVRFLKHCTTYMTPLYIQGELRKLRLGGDDKLQLRVVQTSTSCSVTIRYHVEEFSVSFAMEIPPEYPLKPITVISGERLGISETKWRFWLLSVQTLLAQNLSIVEVIRQWRVNAEKALEGIEPCSICYCVLQPSDRSLPSPSCKTCKNKFHSACLYKWFKTHGQASCPMCRSLF